MTLESVLQPHQDWKNMKDIQSVPNAVVPYGDYDGRDLVLWQAKYVIELRPGDALLFMGSLICHGNTKITRGVRNSVNLFTHQSNIDWIELDPGTRKKRAGGKNEINAKQRVEVIQVRRRQKSRANCVIKCFLLLCSVNLFILSFSYVITYHFNFSSNQL